MSRIAVVTSSPPQVEGGHLVIARALVDALRSAGHDAETVITPDHGFGHQASAYFETWTTNVTSRHGQPIDQVISLRYPSYAVRHPRHVCWLNHTMREYYDLWDRFSATLSPRGRSKERIRRYFIHRADRYLLTRNVTKVFVQSRTIQQRFTMWPELRSEVLYPPAPQRAYRCDGYGDYIFMVSRLTPLKRAALVIEALRWPQALSIRAVIAGEGEEDQRLRSMIDDAGMRDRVQLVGCITDDQLIDHLARCRAVCFPPRQEDYGFVTAEAFASRKPVITCRDSGGPAELVTNGVSGFVVDPNSVALANAMRMLIDDASLAERMGQAAHARGAELNWADTVRRLTSYT